MPAKIQKIASFTEMKPSALGHALEPMYAEMQAVAEKYGLTLIPQGGSIQSATDMKLRFAARVAKPSVKAADSTAAKVNMQLQALGIKAKYGDTFEAKGYTWRIVAVNNKATKYPVVCAWVEDDSDRMRSSVAAMKTRFK